MTVQTILTYSIVAILAVFAVSFLLDLCNATRKAWSATKPQAEPQPEIENKQESLAALPEIKIASLDWVQPKEEEYSLEIVDVIELAKAIAPQPKPEPQPEKQPKIVTLPQTQEAAQFEKWLNQRPDRSTLEAMTVKKLRQEAKVWNVRNIGNMSKKEIVNAILTA